MDYLLKIKKESLTSLVLAALAWFGCLLLLDSFDLTIYSLSSGVTKTHIFKTGFKLIPLTLFLIIIWVIWFFILGKMRYIYIIILIYSMIRQYDRGLVLATLSIICVIIGLYVIKTYRDFFNYVISFNLYLNIFVILNYIMNTFFKNDILYKLYILSINITSVSYYFIPIMMVLMLSMGLFRSIINYIFNIDYKTSISKLTKNNYLILSFSIIISIISVIYSQFILMDYYGGNIGVDINNYIHVYDEIISEGPKLINFFNSPKPLFFILLYLLDVFIPAEISLILKFLPLIFNPLLVYSLYYFSYEVFENDELSGWVSFFTATGITVQIGIYSYFISNTLGLVLIFFSMGFLFKSINDNNKKWLFLSIIFSVLVLYIHHWTSDQYVYSLVILYILLIQPVYQIECDECAKNNIFILLMTLVAFKVLNVIYMPRVDSIIASDTIMGQYASFDDFWASSMFGFMFLYGGFLSNFLLIALSIYGLFYFNYKKVNYLFFHTLNFSSLVVYFISDAMNKSRLIYNLPLGIYAAIGYILIKKYNEHDIRWTVFIILSFIVQLLNNLSNLV